MELTSASTADVPSEWPRAFDALLLAIPDAVIAADGHGTIRHISASAERLIGCRADEVVGQNIFASQVVRSLAEHLDGSRPAATDAVHRLVVRHHDGHEISVELRVAEMLVGEERLRIGFIREVAPLQVESRSNPTSDLALQGASAIDAAAMIIEIAQPLAAITNFLSAAERLITAGSDPLEIGELLKLARSQAARAGQIIRRFRDLSETRDAQMRSERIADIAAEAEALAFSNAGAAKVKITHAIDAGATLAICDRLQIRQALVVLFRHAAGRAQTPEVGDIDFSATPLDLDRIEIRVSDTGPRLSDETLQQLRRKGGARSGPADPGLALCRQIVEDHDGEMTAENRTGGGAMISFTLPRDDDKEERHGSQHLHR